MADAIGGSGATDNTLANDYASNTAPADGSSGGTTGSGGASGGATGADGATSSSSSAAEELKKTFEQAIAAANETRAVAVQGQTELDAAKQQPR